MKHIPCACHQREVKTLGAILWTTAGTHSVEACSWRTPDGAMCSARRSEQGLWDMYDKYGR